MHKATRSVPRSASRAPPRTRSPSFWSTLVGLAQPTRSSIYAICPARTSRLTRCGASCTPGRRTWRLPRPRRRVRATSGRGRLSAPIRSWCRAGWLARGMANTPLPSSMICASAWRTACSSRQTVTGHTWTPLRKPSATMWTMPSCIKTVWHGTRGSDAPQPSEVYRHQA